MVAGRHQCQPVAVKTAHCASVYGLGDRFNQNHVSVETHLWWKAGWQLHWHHIVAHQKAKLRLGSYSLPLYDSKAETSEITEQYGYARETRNGIGVQTILGFKGLRRLDSDPDKRTHLLTWHSLVLLAETAWLSGKHDLVALTWAGKPSDESQPWSVEAAEK